ncbi:uncharacterized protein [Apostichopus japonicus]|uniref:uncharacterized protein n=1 Tax=Stichopus japonicus TaxID=307972 RepID=UPI003AB7FF58
MATTLGSWIFFLLTLLLLCLTIQFRSGNCQEFETCPPDRNNCNSPFHRCLLTKTDVSFCVCMTGYGVGDQSNTCVDIDECETPDSCDNAICQNTEGSFLCVCNEGFVHGSTENACIDRPTVEYRSEIFYVNELENQLRVMVFLNHYLQDEVATLSLTSEDISTSQGLDYIDFTATVTFQPMTTSSSFVIDIIDDDLLEATESFNVVAFDSSYILFDPQLPLFEVFIYDDDVTHIELTSTVSSLTEGPGVDNRTIITVESSKQVQIGYQSIIVGLDLSLTAGIPNVCGGFVPTSNFMMESYQLTIPPGQQSASTLLSLLDDDIIEVRGCIVISISSVSWGSGREGLQQTTSARTPFVIVVQDDDTASVTLSQSEVSLAEGNVGALTAAVSLNIQGLNISLFFPHSSQRFQIPNVVQLSKDSLSAELPVTALDNDVVDGPDVSAIDVVMRIDSFLMPTTSVQVRNDFYRRVTLQTPQLTIRITDNDIAIVTIAKTRVNLTEGSSESLMISSSQLISAFDLVLSFDDSNAKFPIESVRMLSGTLFAYAEITSTDNDVVDGPMTSSFTISLSIEPTSTSTRVEIVNDVNQRVSLQTPNLTVVIEDDDIALLSFTILRVAAIESQGSVILPFSLSREVSPQIRPDNIVVLTRDGGATSSIDFVHDSDPARFSVSSETEGEVEILIIPDDLQEDDETFQVYFGEDQQWEGIIINQLSSSVEVLIIDDDTMVPLSVNVTRIITEESSQLVNILFWTSKPHDENLSFDLITEDGSAKAQEDYILNITRVTIEAGDTYVDIPIYIIDDDLNEDTEEFVVRAVNPSGALRVSPGRDRTTVVIQDNDKLKNGFYVSMAKSSIEVSEADNIVSIPIVYGKGLNPNDTFNLRFTTRDKTARQTLDFALISDFILAPEQSFINIRILQDDILEGDESFQVNLTFTDPLDLLLINMSTTVKILDDDNACVRIMDASVNETRVEVDIFIQLESIASTDISVDITIESGTAVLGEDFRELSSTSLVIPASQRQVTGFVSIIDDEIREIDESFMVRATSVTSPARICFGVSSATITILANDPGPVLVFCPSDTIYSTVDMHTPVVVKWVPAIFDKGQDLIANYSGFSKLETVLLPEESKLIEMTATDVHSRTTVCSFIVRVELRPAKDLVVYNISAMLSDDGQSSSRSGFQTWLTNNYRRGRCRQDFAGVQVTEFPTEGGSLVSYYLFLEKSTECCLQEILKDFNDDVDDTNSLIIPDDHQADVLFYRLSMTMEVEAGFDTNAYIDTSTTEYRELRDGMIGQLNSNLSSNEGFLGVCLRQLSAGSILSILSVEMSPHSSVEFTAIQTQLSSFASTSLTLPRGIIRPEERRVQLTEICDGTCRGNGICFVPAGGYVANYRCHAGFTGIRCCERDSDYCLSGQQAVGDYPDVQFPVGLVGEEIFTLEPNPCTLNQTDDDTKDGEETLQILYSNCVRTPNNPVWNETGINCNATLNEYLSYLQTRTIDEDNIADISEQLANASVKLDNEGGMAELTKLAQLIGDITNITGPKDPAVVDSLAVTISNIISVDQQILDDLNQQGMLSVIAQAFEQVLNEVIVNNETGTYSQGTENIATMVVEGDPSMLIDFSVGTFPADFENSNDTAFEMIQQLNASEVNQKIPGNATNVFLFPPELQDQLTSDTARVAFAVYRTPSLFSSRHYNQINNEQTDYNRRVKRRYGPNTRVVSTTVMSGDQIIREWGDGSTTFRQWYRVLNTDLLADAEGASCTFWSFNADGGRGNWSTDGCKLGGYDPERNLIMCECTHLTNFAVLMDIYEHDSLSDTQYTILEAVTFFGCAASILGLGVTFLAFISHKRLREKRPSQILIWLSFSLLGLYVSFLIMAAFDSERTRQLLPPLQCNILAGVTHFFTLSSLCWMLVEGVNMYILFVRIVNNHISRFMLKAFLFAEVLPLVIVAVTYVTTEVIFKASYARESVCFVNGVYPIIGGVAIPILFIVVTNMVLYTLVVCRLSKRVSNSARNDKRKRQEQVKRVQNAVSIFLLMGLSWGVGYFCFIPVGSNFAFAIQLVFVGFNSMQGYLIFMFYCMRNPDFRKRWRRWCFCICPATFPFQRSLSSSIVATFSKGENSSSRNAKFQSRNVPVSIVERRRTSAFRELDSQSVE